ncbi:hypothetical protein G6024_00025 [Dietzia maris]|nr:hypothetical protein [Dietzia maris]MBB0995513.1 hypothetical protein [Dietzia maris]
MSDPIPGNYNSSMRVTSHPVQDGRQLSPEVRVREGNVEVLSMSPAAARAMAAALTEAADHAEGVQ